ncbi:hypothetical protein DIPPA_18155 [Diplonema papillatum]|nr:hypothetical protein DIPPA_18155 [Diplonema papillatum]
MHVIDCTTLDANKLVVEAMGKMTGSGGSCVTLKGEGKYVSTVSLAVAMLCSEYMHGCRVTSWHAQPSDSAGLLNKDIVPSLSVSFQPVAGGSVPAPLGSGQFASHTPSQHPKMLPSPVPHAMSASHPPVHSAYPVADSPVFTSSR